ncbi:probable potassium transporter 17 [Tanacetum coccineum]
MAVTVAAVKPMVSTMAAAYLTVGPADDDHLVTVDDNSSTAIATATGNSPLLLAYKSVGVVFGGLVTSSLYVYPSMALKSPTTDDYLGIYSIMFWTLTLIGVVKYACIALKSDDQGEGISSTTIDAFHYFVFLHCMILLFSFPAYELDLPIASCRVFDSLQPRYRTDNFNANKDHT